MWAPDTAPLLVANTCIAIWHTHRSRQWLSAKAKLKSFFQFKSWFLHSTDAPIQSKSIKNDKFFDKVLIISFLNVSRFQNSFTIDTDLANSIFDSKLSYVTVSVSALNLSLCDYAHSKVNWHRIHRYCPPLYTHHSSRVASTVQRAIDRRVKIDTSDCVVYFSKFPLSDSVVVIV